MHPLDVLAWAREIFETQERTQEEDENSSSSNSLGSPDTELIRRLGTVAVNKLSDAEGEDEEESEEKTIKIEKINFHIHNLRDQDRTFPQILEIARTITKVLSYARPLHPSDLHLPEDSRTDRVDDEGVDIQELEERADAARDGLKSVHDDLKGALENNNHAELRASLERVSSYGLSYAFPAYELTSKILVELGQDAALALQRRLDKLESERKKTWRSPSRRAIEIEKTKGISC